MLRFAITNRPAAIACPTQNRPPSDPFASLLAGLLADVHRWTTDAVDFILLRETGLTPPDLLPLVRAAVHTRDQAFTGQPPRQPSPTPRSRLLVHAASDPTGAIAAAAGADGLHLPGAWARSLGTPPIAASAPLRSPGNTPVPSLAAIVETFRQSGLARPTLSASCHTIAEVQAAAAAGIDLILFGPIFEKVVSGQAVAPALGLDQLRQAAATAPPATLLALGGVTWRNAPACLDAGAGGVAGIRLFSAPPDLEPREPLTPAVRRA